MSTPCHIPGCSLLAKRGTKVLPPIGLVALAACAFVAMVSSAAAASASRESFDLAVPAPPSPVTIDAREWLVYELHLTNFSRESLRVSRIDVRAGNGENLQSLEGEDLARRMVLAAASRSDAQSVRPGERAIVYLEVPLRMARPPALLRHHLRYRSDAGEGVADVIGGEARVIGKAHLALGPPLRGGPWAAVYAWHWPRGHRRVFYTLDGRARVPGRFAIDWVRKDAQGLSARGDADVVRNSLGYGAEVLAVANARVAAVRDGVAESERVSASTRHSLDEAAGNYVSLDLGDGRFAVYEHLAPGSIRVATGDRVRRGQVIAALGFTGDSTEPHLHFHVADAASPLSGEGLPFEFEQHGGRGRPAPNALVTFD